MQPWGVGCNVGVGVNVEDGVGVNVKDGVGVNVDDAVDVNVEDGVGGIRHVPLLQSCVDSQHAQTNTSG